MAISITWETKVINIPKNDMLLIQSVPTEIRELDIDTFRLELKALEASAEGMPFIDTHSHNPPVTVGGVTLARVVEIINGYTITFEDGQYAVNLAGANSNIADVTNVNQVSVRSANSAGLTYSKEIEDQSFTEARIWIDTVNGSAGTQFPLGTPGNTSNNLIDAQFIIQNRNMPKRLHLKGLLNVSSGQDLTDYNIRGESHKNAEININNSDTTGLVVSSAIVKGNLSGQIYMNHYGELEDVTGFLGEAILCELGGTISLAAGDKHEFISCYSGKPGVETPIIDCNNLSNLNLAIRDYTGGIELINLSESGTKISIDLNSGHLILGSSVTLVGELVVRGTGHITNNSSIIPITDGLSADKSTLDILRKFNTNRMETDRNTGILKLYDDDNSILYSGNIYENTLATQLYRGRGIERRNKLT